MTTTPIVAMVAIAYLHKNTAQNISLELIVPRNLSLVLGNRYMISILLEYRSAHCSLRDKRISSTDGRSK